jgi:formiminoglutamase
MINEDKQISRETYKAKKQFKEDVTSIPFILASSDIGVRRNLGRNGSRFAPESILSQFKNLVVNNDEITYQQYECASQSFENEDFQQAQLQEAKNIQDILASNQSKKLIHIGGGHDHIYPLLKAAELSGFTKICVLNIDAHCDTRQDSEANSGTPFRQHDTETKVTFRMSQFGIQPFANSKATLKPLLAQSEITYFNKAMSMDYLALEKHFLQFFDSSQERALYILSLDCDAVEGSLMEGVSAVAHLGFTAQKIAEMVSIFKKIDVHATKAFGMYEYNPIYDNLSNKGSRFLAGLIHEFIY